MAITNLSEITDAQKEELVASLACLVIGEGELTSESVQAVATASGNSVSDSLAALFATVVGNSKDGMKTFTPPPGGGGGGGYVSWLNRKRDAIFRLLHDFDSF